MIRIVALAAAAALAGCASSSKGEPGAPGQPVVSAALDPGSAACPHGGSQFTAASGTTYACNGAPGAQGGQGSKGDAGAQGPPGPVVTNLTGLVGFDYSSVSGVAPVPVAPPAPAPAYVPRDDGAHPLSVSVTANSPNDAFMVFFALGARYFGGGPTPNAATLRVQVSNADRTLYFPAQDVAVWVTFALSGAVLVTQLPAGTYAVTLWTDTPPGVFDGPRHLTVYRVQ